VTDVVVLVPMLGREHRVAPLLASLSASCDARPLFLLSQHDEPVRAAVEAMGADHVTVPGPGPGDYARKINTGLRESTEPLLFLGADDLHFHPGWLEAATAKLAPGIGVVGTNDLGSKRVMAGIHATHSLVTRTYAETFGTIDEPGKILHEGYPHEYVDDELVGTAKHRKAWAFAFDSRVEHLHPAWGKAPVDAMYGQQRRRMAQGRPIFEARKHLWT